MFLLSILLHMIPTSIPIKLSPLEREGGRENEREGGGEGKETDTFVSYPIYVFYIIIELITFV